MLRVFRRTLVALVAAGLLAFLSPRVSLCQSSCCVLPNQETTTPSGSESDTTWVGGDFVQQISNAEQPPLSYSGYLAREVEGSPGNNGCYFPGGEIGQHPGIFGPGGNEWQVGTASQWRPDFIGFHTLDAQQIYQEEQAGAVPNGCDTVTYQTMQIDCNGVFRTYLSDVEQDRLVYSNESMKACRITVSPVTSSGSITIPPT